MKQIILLVLLFLTYNPVIYAQIIDEKTTHTVKSGETLRSITRSYLDTDILWKENWQLNPQVQNPNILTIGQKLTIIKERFIPAEKATMVEIVNKVEKKSEEKEWHKAISGEKISQKEGIRTYDNSSALLKFNDESELKIMAFSQIFLQSRETTLSGTDSSTIEITKGDAELIWEPLKIGKSEIILISGGTVLKPTVQLGKQISIKSGMTSQGESTVSMYQGQSEIESAGATVSIPQGMGLKVLPGKAPPQPKPLLKAPIIGKVDNNTYNYSNPIIHWGSINAAKMYTVEICKDESCNQILSQIKIDSNKWKVNNFNKEGQFFWRVAAISIDDIVGYRSLPQSIHFTSSQEDNTKPIIAIQIIGKQQMVDGYITISNNSKVVISSFDSQSGIKTLEYKFNEGDWIEYSGELAANKVGSTTLFIKAVDWLGQTTIKEYHFKTS